MTPSGTICICANTNMKYQSEDTIVFASESAKRTYFDNKVIKTFTNQQYTRANVNGVSSTLNGKLYVAPGTSSIKVDCPIGQIYNADYMFYVDTGYSGKTFYNFITDVSYVSDAVTQITFTEDVFMTWQNNITIQNSFVERESTSSDVTYSDAHDLPDILSGEYREYGRMDIQSGYTSSKYGCMVLNTLAVPYIDLNENKIHIETATITSGQVNTGEYYSCYGKNQNRLDNLVYVFFKLNDILGSNLLQRTFAAYVNHSVQSHIFDKQSGKYDILGIFSLPEISLPDLASTFLNNNQGGLYFAIPSGSYHLPLGSVFSVPSDIYVYAGDPTYVDLTAITLPNVYYNMGYTPKNKKLYSAPYCYYMISNNQGQNLKFKPQHFPRSNEQVSVGFRMIGSYSANSANVDLIPIGYERPDNPTSLNPTYKLSIDNYPEVPFQFDKLADYNQAKLISNTISTIGSLSNFANGITNTISNAQPDKKGNPASGIDIAGNIIGNVTSGINIAGNVVNALQDYQLSTKWDFPEVHGTDKTGVVPVAEQLMKFSVIAYALDIETVKSIDNLFTRYGYSVKKIKSVSLDLNNRQNFHFVQTSGCNITGNVPMYVKNYLNDRFDKGIRMWAPSHYLSDFENNPLVS